MGGARPAGRQNPRRERSVEGAGRAILEFNWFDVDPALPDAATSIVRLYNRARRRWECLYVPNRGQSMLWFGGRREGDRIVLTVFDTDAAAPTMSRFVFHDIAEDGYRWYSERSADCGATFEKTWIIRVERAAEAEAEPAATPVE